MVLEVSDLIQHFRIDRTLTGIQRVQLNVVEAILADDPDTLVCSTAGERWVQEQAATPLPPVAPGQSRLRTQGVYLITGGLGGVGCHGWEPG